MGLGTAPQWQRTVRLSYARNGVRVAEDEGASSCAVPGDLSSGGMGPLQELVDAGLHRCCSRSRALSRSAKSEMWGGIQDVPS